MRHSWSWVLALGLSVAARAAAPDAEAWPWPADWRAFGPVPAPAGMRGGSAPAAEDLLPGARFMDLPATLVIGGREYPGRPVAFPGGRLDLGGVFGGSERGNTAYLATAIHADSARTVRVYAGADWWMQWWLNGTPVFGTIPAGNEVSPVAVSNHSFTLTLRPGRNILAAAVIGGSMSWTLAAGGPNELKAGESAATPRPAGFQAAFEAARAARTPAAAEMAYRSAAASADKTGDKAKALLAAARARLDGGEPADAPDIRALLEEVRALPGLEPAQQAEAWLGLAEAGLLASDYAAAESACAAAEKADANPVSRAQAQRARALGWLQRRDYGRAGAALGRLLEMEGLDGLDSEPARRTHQARAEIEAWREALEFLPLLRPDRPRLFFTAETWPAVRERALTTDKARFDKLATEVEALPVNSIPPDIAHQMMEAAFVYRVTGTPAVLEKVRRMLRVALDGTSYSAYPRVCWAAAFDWVWEDLPPPERVDLARAMTRLTWRHYVSNRRAGNLVSWPHYYSASALYYLGLALLSGELDDVAHVRALSVLAVGLKMHRDRIAALLETAGDDGAWQTNIEYDFSTVPGPMVLFLSAWTPATGLPLPAEWAYAAVNPEFILRMVPGYERDVFLHLNYAGHSGGAWGYGNTYSGNLYEYLEAYRHFFGRVHPDQAALAHELCRRMSAFENSPLTRPDVFNRSGQAYPALRFLLTDLERAPAPGLPAGLPIARHYEGNGLVLMSSGFGAADTYALFSAGEGGGPPPRRHDYDAGHFSIYRTGYLALDTGVRNALGHSANYRHQTVAHNAVLIRMDNEPFTSVSGPVTSNAGGQNQYPHEARTLAFSSRPLYAYVAADLAPVYHPDKCAAMTRQFVFVPPAHVVVFDRAVSRQAGQPKTWLLHTANEPVLAGREFQADQGSGRLFCRTLLPEDAVLETIGGPGREFWADGRNWPIEDAYRAPDNSARTQPTGTADWWPRYGHAGHDGQRHTEPVEVMGRWRVEVKPGAARTDDLFLHLIEVGDQATLTAMSPSTRIEEPGAAGVEFQAGTHTVRVVFNTGGAVGGGIRLTDGSALLAEEPLATTVQRQEGLAREQ